MTEIRVTGADGAPLDDDTLTRPAGHALPGATEVVRPTPAPVASRPAAPAPPGSAEVVRTTPEAMTPRPGELTLDPHPVVPTPPPEALDDPYEARAAIERTRSRMSETIDTIEEVLLRKKTEIQDKLDVLAPVRENPLPVAAAVFGAGLLLGFLTGGDDHHELEYDGRDEGLAPAAAAERRWRSRHNSLRARHSELEDVVKQQRKELKRVRRELDQARRAQRSAGGAGAGYARPIADTPYGGTYGSTAYGSDAAAAAYGYESTAYDRYDRTVEPRTTYDYDAVADDDAGTMEALGDAVTSLKESVIGGITELVSDAFGRMRGRTDNEQDRVINPT